MKRLAYFPWFEYHHRRESSQPSVKKQTEVLTFKATVLVVSYRYHFTTEPLSLPSRHPMLTAGSGSLPPLGAAASLRHLAPRPSPLAPRLPSFLFLTCISSPYPNSFLRCLLELNHFSLSHYYNMAGPGTNQSELSLIFISVDLPPVLAIL